MSDNKKITVMTLAFMAFFNSMGIWKCIERIHLF